MSMLQNYPADLRGLLCSDEPSLVLSALCWSSLLRWHHTKQPNEPTYCERAVEHHSKLQLYFHHLLLLINERSSWHRLFHAFLETGNNSTSMKAGFRSNMPNIRHCCETCSTVVLSDANANTMTGRRIRSVSWRLKGASSTVLTDANSCKQREANRQSSFFHHFNQFFSQNSLFLFLSSA